MIPSVAIDIELLQRWYLLDGRWAASKQLGQPVGGEESPSKETRSIGLRMTRQKTRLAQRLPILGQIQIFALEILQISLEI